MTKSEILNCIYQFCLDCSDGSTSAVTSCEASECELYKCRMGELGGTTMSKEELLEAVKQSCSACNDYDNLCLYENCEIYPITKEL